MVFTETETELNFLGPVDFTNAECQLNGLEKLVSIVSQLIIQSVKGWGAFFPGQYCFITQEILKSY